ncbi:hypothetical protein OG552_15695 [Streptomyces sp. NBC_01476]|uniref:hypothetical protein n=1 Tax=Streptomyces sp. NBC_01476 TaxID=2903881 RepID=UPI002E2F59C3|nr:hypothetical protein [Streptomyces sp. NBC_01476]
MSPRSTRRKSPAALQVSGGGSVYVVHAPGPLPDQLADAAGSLIGAAAVTGQATVLVGAGFDDPDLFCDELAPTLDELTTSGVSLLRLVMSGGALELPDRAAPARRITERWDFDVLAPAGAAVVVPGGTLFAPDLPGAPGAWWHFSRGLLPRRLGARHPEPSWHTALDRVAADTAEGCVVHHVPAGLLILPSGVPPEGVDAIRFALPVDPAGPVLLVGAAGAPPVPADALADVVAALPAQVRGTVRLLPGDSRDLLLTGQEVADLLGIEVQVANGLPVLLDDGAARPGSPWDHPTRGATPRTMLLDADGNPSWRPYVEAVTCMPATPAPRLASWRPPIGGLRPGPEPGTLLLDRNWQVAVTRAGLWIGPRTTRIPDEAASRPVEPDVMAIDLGHPDEVLDEATLLPPLQRLFAALQDDVRERTMIQVHGEASPEALRALRRLAVHHGLAVSPRGWRAMGVGVAPAGPAALSAVPDPVAPAPAAIRPPAEASAPERPAAPARPVATGAAPDLRIAGEPARRTTPAAAPDPAPPRPPVTESGGRPAEPPAAAGGSAAGVRSSVTESGGSSDAGSPAAGSSSAAGVRPSVTGPGGSVGAEPPVGVRSSVTESGGSSDAGSGSLVSEGRPTAPGTPRPPVTESGGARTTRPEAESAGEKSGAGAEAAGSPAAATSGGRAAESSPAWPVREWASPARTPDEAEAPVRPAEPSPPTGLSGPKAPEGEEEPSATAAVPPSEAPGRDAAGDGAEDTAGASAEDTAEDTAPATAEDTAEDTAEEATAAGPSGSQAGPESEAGIPAAEEELPEPPRPVPSVSAAGGLGPEPVTPEPDDAELPELPPAAVVTSGGPGPEAWEGAAPAGPAEPSAAPPLLRGVSWVPVTPGHHSSDAERDAVRAYLGPRWDHHSAAVTRALTRVPALRSSAHPEEVAADLAALHAYMTAVDDETHRDLRESLAGGRSELVPVLACLASGLRRLPSYRGAAVRPAGGVLGEAAELLLPGEELGEALPVSGVAVDKGYPTVAADHYLIWSMTGRRASSLLGDAETAAGGDTAPHPDEVLFAPGTRFRLLAVDSRSGATVILLRELPESAPSSAATPGQLDDADTAALKRLQAIKDQPAAVGSAHQAPERCAGPLGVLGVPETPVPGSTTP